MFARFALFSTLVLLAVSMPFYSKLNSDEGSNGLAGAGKKLIDNAVSGDHWGSGLADHLPKPMDIPESESLNDLAGAGNKLVARQEGEVDTNRFGPVHVLDDIVGDLVAVPKDGVDRRGDKLAARQKAGDVLPVDAGDDLEAYYENLKDGIAAFVKPAGRKSYKGSLE